MDESIPLSVLAIIFDGGQLVAVFLFGCCNWRSNGRNSHPLKRIADEAHSRKNGPHPRISLSHRLLL